MRGVAVHFFLGRLGLPSVIINFCLALLADPRPYGRITLKLTLLQGRRRRREGRRVVNINQTLNKNGRVLRSGYWSYVRRFSGAQARLPGPVLGRLGRHQVVRTLCYAIVLPGRKSAFRAGFRSDCYRECTEMGPPAGLRPTGGPTSVLAR